MTPPPPPSHAGPPAAHHRHHDHRHLHRQRHTTAGAQSHNHISSHRVTSRATRCILPDTICTHHCRVCARAPERDKHFPLKRAHITRAHAQPHWRGELRRDDLHRMQLAGDARARGEKSRRSTALSSTTQPRAHSTQLVILHTHTYSMHVQLFARLSGKWRIKSDYAPTAYTVSSDQM